MPKEKQTANTLRSTCGTLKSAGQNAQLNIPRIESWRAHGSLLVTSALRFGLAFRSPLLPTNDARCPPFPVDKPPTPAHSPAPHARAEFPSSIGVDINTRTWRSQHACARISASAMRNLVEETTLDGHLIDKVLEHRLLYILSTKQLDGLDDAVRDRILVERKQHFGTGSERLCS